MKYVQLKLECLGGLSLPKISVTLITFTGSLDLKSNDQIGSSWLNYLLDDPFLAGLNEQLYCWPSTNIKVLHKRF